MCSVLDCQTFIGVCVHSHLEAVIEEEECDMFPAITRLVSQGDGFHSINQAAVGGQQVGLQRAKRKLEGNVEKGG